MNLTYPVTLSVLPSLRHGGVKVSIRHERYLYCTTYGKTITGPVRYGRGWETEYGDMPYPNGGKTTVDLVFPDGGSYTGVALCSLQDRFCRRTGIAIALSRALEARKVHRIHGSISGIAGETVKAGQLVKVVPSTCGETLLDIKLERDRAFHTTPISYNPMPYSTIHTR